MKTFTNPSHLTTPAIFAPMDAMLRGVAKVFMTGRSQAVRLPKEFRFNSKEVTIEKVGNAVVLRPVQTRDEWWAQMESAMDGLRGQIDFVDRDQTPPSDDIASFD